MARKLGIARFWYEGNSFSPLLTHIEDFKKEEWVSGPRAFGYYRDIESEMGGAVTFAKEHPDWEISFLHCCSAPPSGPIADATFTEIQNTLLEKIQTQKWDAFYLSLHGAAITQTNPTPDLDLIKNVRRIIGSIPLVITFDFHANLAHEMIDLADILVGYKTYPHIDMAETALKALRLLDQHMRGHIAVHKSFRKIPLILPSFNMRTDEGPMDELKTIAKRLDVTDISLFGGFAYGDSPFFGPSISVMGKNQDDADRAADLMENEWRQRVPQFFVTFPTASEALAQIPKSDRPIILLDPADNPLSGGIGDTTSLLGAMLEHPECGPALFAFFYDPDLVALCHAKEIGAMISVQLGGRLAPKYGAPLSVQARILKNTDGCFKNEGPMWQGAQTNLGKTSLLEVGHLLVIVTETCQSPNDPAYFTLHELDIMKFKTIGVKAKNHFRAAFKDKAGAMIDIDCPGPASINLSHYPYHYAKEGLPEKR